MDHERLVNEVGYDKSRGTQHRDLPTVSGALVYDDPSSGVAIMLIVHQAISCEYLPRSRGVKAKGSRVTITIDV